MDFNANLPVLVPAVIGLIVVSVVAVLVLSWNRRSDIERIVRWAWLAAVVLIVMGVAVFWLSTAMVEGPKRSIVDRTMQKQQQQELTDRLKSGGH